MDYQSPTWTALERRWIGDIPAPCWLQEIDRNRGYRWQ